MTVTKNSEDRDTLPETTTLTAWNATALSMLRFAMNVKAEYLLMLNVSLIKNSIGMRVKPASAVVNARPIYWENSSFSRTTTCFALLIAQEVNCA